MGIHTDDPVQAIIWHCLENYDLKNAVFLSERLCAEVETEETIFLLATSYYRAKQLPQAYWLLKKKCCRSAKCRYLQARCAYELKDYYAAVHILKPNVEADELNCFQAITKEFGDIACFALQLLAEIYRQTERHAMAGKAYQAALKHNPFLWQAFVELCNMGEEVVADETFQMTAAHRAELTQVRYYTKKIQDDRTEDSAVTRTSCLTPKQYLNVAPRVICKTCSTPLNDESVVMLNRNVSVESGFALLTEQFSSLTSISPVTPGLVSKAPAPELEVVEVVSEKKLQAIKAGEATQQTSGNGSAGRPHVFTPAGNTPMRSMLERQPLKASLSATETESAKENKQSFALSKWSPRKLKYRFTKETNLDESDEESSLNASVKTENVSNETLEYSKHENFDASNAAVDEFMALLCDFGIGYKLLASYQCQKAIEHFEQHASKHQLHTCGVQSFLAKCHYELQHYDVAAAIFKNIHETEPCRFEHMDIYSSCLWQLQHSIELSVLAKELIDHDRLSPITWLVAGNCFSLQHDHTTAIKLIQRAVQLDASYAYCHILLGYEHIAHEDLDEARNCFAQAVACDSRHYNAWFGLATTYAKQQNHQKAEFYFRKALRINPTNAVILVHIGVMQHAQRHYQQALQTLNTASKLDPNNLIAKLQRARIYFSLKRYRQALHQLEELKNMAPMEAIVFQLLGNVHQAMGNKELALMYFSWSTDMDTKKAEPFTPVLPKRSL